MQGMQSVINAQTQLWWQKLLMLSLRARRASLFEEEEENPIWNSCLVWKQTSEAIRFQVWWSQITAASDAVVNILSIILKGIRWNSSWRTAVVKDWLSILKDINSSPLLENCQWSIGFKNNSRFYDGSISWWSHLATPGLCKVAWRLIHPDYMSHLKSVLDKVTLHTWNAFHTRTQHSVTIWPCLPGRGRKRENLLLRCLLTLVR